MSAPRVDPVTQQIVGNALASIADEMATTIFRTAHSTVVRDGMDFSAAHHQVSSLAETSITEVSGQLAGGGQA